MRPQAHAGLGRKASQLATEGARQADALAALRAKEAEAATKAADIARCLEASEALQANLQERAKRLVALAREWHRFRRPFSAAEALLKDTVQVEKDVQVQFHCAHCAHCALTLCAVWHCALRFVCTVWRALWVVPKPPRTPARQVPFLERKLGELRMRAAALAAARAAAEEGGAPAGGALGAGGPVLQAEQRERMQAVLAQSSALLASCVGKVKLAHRSLVLAGGAAAQGLEDSDPDEDTAGGDAEPGLQGSGQQEVKADEQGAAGGC